MRRLFFDPRNVSEHVWRPFFEIRVLVFVLLVGFMTFLPQKASAQCIGDASTPQSAADCASRSTPQEKIASLVPGHVYTLAELIDIAERNNPRARIVWERAKQKADQLGVARSAYYPVLAAEALFAGERIIDPFPKPLAPLGYTVVRVPLVQPEVTLQYLIFDFGRRAVRVDAATAEKLAAGANFIRTNQEIAFRVSSAFYKLVTAQEQLQAAEETLKTAQTTQDAADARLHNGRATLPDVLNAKAETSQAVFDRESADGSEKIARVTLTEAIGVEPSPEIAIDNQQRAALPQLLTMPVDELMTRAMAGRPDLQAQAQAIRAADDAVRTAKAEYRPTIGFSGNVAQTSIWPTSSYGELGSASKPTWSAGLSIDWRLFDGGARKNELAAAESRRREAKDDMTEKRDEVTREVWTAFISFRTALRKEDAAEALLDSANASYSASLEAYKYGVKNLIDVVTAEKQLAQARLSSVSARSQLLLEAVDIEFVTGNLLRSQPLATKPQTPEAPKP
jgi:outer membrane protein